MTTRLEFISTTRAELCFLHPESANALSTVMVSAVSQQLEQAIATGVKVLVIKAEGKNFCAGFDLSAYDTESQESLVDRFEALELLLQRLRHAPLVTVALVQGAAYGAGADLVAACRYRIGLPDCRFKFPGSRFGVVLGTSHLAHIVGVRNAQDIILRNQLLTSARALELGLLDAIVQDNSAFSAWLECLENDLADLDTATLQQLLNLLVPDTRSRDIQALLHSVKRPGLQERIAHYRAAASKQNQALKQKL